LNFGEILLTLSYYKFLINTQSSKSQNELDVGI
jgi:hypothetical protein